MRFGVFCTITLGFCGLTAGMALPSPAVAASQVESVRTDLIPYEKFTLANGLTVVVHTDRKAPIVAVNVWYHVGSKNEAARARPGSRTCSST